MSDGRDASWPLTPAQEHKYDALAAFDAGQLQEAQHAFDLSVWSELKNHRGMLLQRLWLLRPCMSCLLGHNTWYAQSHESVGCAMHAGFPLLLRQLVASNLDFRLYRCVAAPDLVVIRLSVQLPRSCLVHGIFESYCVSLQVVFMQQRPQRQPH